MEVKSLSVKVHPSYKTTTMVKTNGMSLCACPTSNQIRLNARATKAIRTWFRDCPNLFVTLVIHLSVEGVAEATPLFASLIIETERNKTKRLQPKLNTVKRSSSLFVSRRFVRNFNIKSKTHIDLLFETTMDGQTVGERGKWLSIRLDAPLSHLNLEVDGQLDTDEII